jgi:hypothetical protein
LTLINNPTITNTGGTISANNNLLAVTSSTVNGGNVTLTGTGTLQMNNSTIHGGTLTNSATGTIEILANSNTLGGTINNSAGGTFKVDNGAILNLEAGTYSQLGTLQLNSTGNFTELVLQGNATLSGGTVTMSNNSQNYIFGAAGSTVLTNQETIQGAGQIGHNQMTLVNSGTINANQSAGIIVDANGGLTNTGTMEATGGTLTLINNPTITNTGGTISANNNLLAVTSSTINGGSVNLTGTGTLQMNNSTIHGGTLTNSATGTIEILANSNTLGGTINNSAGGTFKVDNGAILNLEAGTYSQLGTLQLNSTGNFTELVIGGNVTLSGGTITMSNNSQNYIFGAAGTDILTNAETIQGAGQIGHSQMGLVNSGTINANASGNIAISVSSSNFNNTGTIEATGGSLTIQGPGTTFFTNDNQTTNTLTGGTYIANGNNIQWAAGSGGINTLAANVTEEGGGQLFNTTNSTNALAGLTSITSAGALTIGGVTFADAGTFSNAGSLTLLPGESFTVGSLTQISGGSLTAGTFVLDANLNLSGATQTITTNAAKLTLAGGTIENANSTNALAGLATNSGTLTIGGTSNNVSTTATTFSNTGTLTINAGDSFTAPKLTQISGTTLSGGTFVLGGNLDLATTGINITTNSSTLTLEGGTIMSGATNALAGLNKNTKTLTLANNANFTTAGSFTNSGTLTVNSGSTFAVNTSGTLTNYNSTTQTLTGGTYSVAGTLSAANLNIVTDAANITLSGTGKLVNATNSANALAGLTTISSTGALTLASNANFTTAGNFTNSGKLTVNSGSTFSVAGTLSNLTSGTLSGGTYTVGGTLQLTGANGGITTNAANLTLTGAAAKILDGTSNELSTFNNNTGSLTLSSSAKLTTASSNFTNSGTVTVSKGTTLTVGGTGHSYTQTAGTTTVDGTLAGSGTTGIVVTGGTVQGAGTLKTNVSSSAAINVGDAGKAGLLSITGTYAQLSSGTLNVSIGGTTVGTQYSQLKVSGTASLGGTLTAALVNAFTPTVGQTFSVLTGSSVSGTFTNTTIAINSSEHFAISYTATSVVLTVVSGPASTGGSSQPLAQMAMAATKPAFGTLQPIRVAGTLRHPIVTSIGKPGIGKPGISRPVLSKPLLLASTGNSKAVLGGRNSRIWEHVPATPSWNRGNGVAVSRIARPVNSAASNLARTGQVRSDLVRPNMLRAENNLRPANNWVGQNHAVPVPVGNWAGVHNPSVMPIRIMKPVLPKIR